SLNYQSLTLAQTLAYIQQCLDKDALQGENDWFQVRNWARAAMLPAGSDLNRFELDKLLTQRPVVVFANDCHTLVANSRALALLGLNEQTPPASDGKIGRDRQGRLTGVLEDAPAMRAFDTI